MGRNWSPKYPVECTRTICDWKGKRTGRTMFNRCPKCRYRSVRKVKITTNPATNKV